MVVDRPEVRNFTEYYSLLKEFVDINLQDTNEYPEEYIFVSFQWLEICTFNRKPFCMWPLSHIEDISQFTILGSIMVSTVV